MAAVETNSKTPTSYNFTVGFQQDIGFKTVLEVAYVGSLSRHLGERRNINQVPDNAHFIDLNPFGPNCNIQVNAVCTRNPFSNTSLNGPNITGVIGDNFLRPYKGYGDINLTTWSGNSNYNSLQIQVNRRYTRGFQYGIAYTYSKTLDYVNDDNADVNNGRPYKAFNYGPADFDQKIAQAKAQAGQAMLGSSFRSDVNVNGVINSTDLAVIKSKVGNAVP